MNPRDTDDNILVLSDMMKRLDIKSPIVVEAGAYDGTDTKTMSKTWPLGTVHSFEPDARMWDALMQNVGGLSNVKTYFVALGGYDGPGRFFLDKGVNTTSFGALGCASILPRIGPPPPDTIEIWNDTDISLMTLDSWAEKYGISAVDILWLDMEGSEPVTLMASDRVLDSVKAVCLEVCVEPVYVGHVTYRPLRDWMIKRGFELYAIDFDEAEQHPSVKPGTAIFIKRGLLSGF